MFSSILAVIWCAAAAFGAPTGTDNRLTDEEKAGGWKLLFDGKTLSGWGILGSKDGWGIEKDAVACMVKRGIMIYTTESWADFILECDFMTDRRVNSGIFVRWETLTDPVNSGMEIQILDSFGRVKPDKHDCGSLYDILPPSVDAVKPAGEWNHIEITCQGPIVRVVLNGQHVINVDLSAWTTAGMNPDGTRNKFTRAYATMTQSGRIGFQDHGGKCWYKNIKLKPLPAWQPPVHG